MQGGAPGQAMAMSPPGGDREPAALPSPSADHEKTNANDPNGPNDVYSARNVTAGSTRVARSAGAAVATTAVVAITMATEA